MKTVLLIALFAMSASSTAQAQEFTQEELKIKIAAAYQRYANHKGGPNAVMHSEATIRSSYGTTLINRTFNFYRR